MKPDKPQGPGNHNRRNLMGIISIVVWALIITLFFNYFASMAGKANTTEVMYGQFQQMVAEDKVYYVEYTSGKYTLLTTIKVRLR